MHIEVNKTDLEQTRTITANAAELSGGQARLSVQRFGFSANNITYAVFGDMMSYWSFFPSDEGWGQIPVWGFAEVVDANGTGLTDGELIYGYFPMGTELIVTPTRVNEGGFVDASPHRSQLPPAYNGYVRSSADAIYNPETEAAQLLFRPLFMTDFLLDDWLADNDMFGASVVVLSSASSKTAFGLAHLLAKRDGIEVVGLTSASRVEFVEGLGVYDRVVSYDNISELPAGQPSVYVDMSGDGGIGFSVHTQMTGLTASVQVGATHWSEVGTGGARPGPAPALFFAPDQVVKRQADWGREGYDQRFSEAWAGILPLIDSMITMVERRGEDAVAATYLEVLSGDVDPSHAFVLSLD